jgi:hypothetical protein
LTPDHVQNKIITMTHEKVVGINQYVISFAYNHVFASIKSRDIEQAFNKTKEGENSKIVLA